MASDLLAKSKAVLAKNDRGGWTVPAGDLYPHQWLWDSCFIAIGLRHIDVERAKTELRSLLRGQWANGMLPHIIFSANTKGSWQHRHEEAWMNPHAPTGVITSGLTQPPMLAEAVVRVGQKLNPTERKAWYESMYPPLELYHRWLYAERDLSGHGLISLIHPYESGFDNTPPVILEMRSHAWPWWLKLISPLRLDHFAKLVRRDIKHVPSQERMSDAESIAYLALMRRLRRQKYHSELALEKPRFALEDLAFNCILIRANKHLASMAKAIGRQLPEDLVASMKASEKGLESFWHKASDCYFSRSSIDERLIKELTIATLLPLYSGAISPERAAHLVKLLEDKNLFAADWPVPSVSMNSSFFRPGKYWQGPTWININWLIIDGLHRYGFEKQAEDLKKQTLKLVEHGGITEYYNPLNGQGLGAQHFSWTAALTIDLLRD